MTQSEQSTAVGDVLTESNPTPENQSSGKPPVMQAVSARLPASLVQELAEAAAQRGLRPSELIREAVEALLHRKPAVIADLDASAGVQMSVVTPMNPPRKENANLFVEIPTEPSHVVAVGYDCLT